MNRPLQQDTPRVLAVCVAFFGALAVAGWAEGLFERLGPDLLTALAIFAAAYALATYALDREVRTFVDGALRIRKAPAKSPGAKRGAT